MYNIRMIVEHGLYLTQVITNLEKRYRVKSKTSFANIFLIDDPWFYDGFIGFIFMIIAFPKYFYDKNTKKLEDKCKRLCYEYNTKIMGLPVDFRSKLKTKNIESFLNGEYVENNKKEFEHIISDNRDRSNYIWINKIREDIRWNNSVLQMETNAK